eukprot:755004-Hanusia_phi.AAC.1
MSALAGGCAGMVTWPEITTTPLPLTTPFLPVLAARASLDLGIPGKVEAVSVCSRKSASEGNLM